MDRVRRPERDRSRLVVELQIDNGTETAVVHEDTVDRAACAGHIVDNAVGDRRVLDDPLPKIGALVVYGDCHRSILTQFEVNVNGWDLQHPIRATNLIDDGTGGTLSIL